MESGLCIPAAGTRTSPSPGIPVPPAPTMSGGSSRPMDLSMRQHRYPRFINLNGVHS